MCGAETAGGFIGVRMHSYNIMLQELLIGNNSVETVSSDMTSALSGCVPTPGNDAQEHGTLMQSQRECIRSKLSELIHVMLL